MQLIIIEKLSIAQGIATVFSATEKYNARLDNLFERNKDRGGLVQDPVNSVKG